MISRFFLNLALVMAFASFSNLFAARPKDGADVRNIRKRIKSLQVEISDMRQSVDDLEIEHRSLVTELSTYENKFQDRFSKVLVPLLSWPSLPPAIQRTSWVEEEHLRLVLMKAREKLVQEPLILISDRELMISRVKQAKEEVSAALKHLESKEGFLNLQLEELQYLQNKFRPKKG